MFRKLMAILVTVFMSTALVSDAFAHCQVPCGIYDDDARFVLMSEHISTVHKAMDQIMALSADPAANMNQVSRWVANKDHHADELSEIATYYFLAQRVKPVDGSDTDAYAAYQEKLMLLHGIVVYAMKAKQTTDVAHCDKLTSLVADFQTAYGK